MMIDAHKTTQILHELSYHYQSEIEMLKDICSRLEHQLILLDENVEINEFRKIFEISRETELNLLVSQLITENSNTRKKHIQF